MNRTDSELIKHLYRTRGAEAASLYNRLPLFIMPSEAEELLANEESLLAATPESLTLPFNDFLIDYPFGISALLNAAKLGVIDRGRCWIRVRRIATMQQDAGTYLNLQHLPLGLASDWLFLEGWEERTITGGLPPAPDHSLIQGSNFSFKKFENYLHWYPTMEICKERYAGIFCNIKHCLHPNNPALIRCSGSELFHAAICRMAVLSLIYLSEGLGGLTTEVSYAPAKNSREEKTERLKPWLAPRRRTYIIIDPSRAGEYGHSSRDTVKFHTSPTPHARRGHRSYQVAI